MLQLVVIKQHKLTIGNTPGKLLARELLNSVGKSIMMMGCGIEVENPLKVLWGGLRRICNGKPGLLPRNGPGAGSPKNKKGMYLIVHAL